MIIHKHENSDSMSEYEYKDLEALDIDEIWYKYNCGSYEGSGQLIARKAICFHIMIWGIVLVMVVLKDLNLMVDL